MIPDPGSATKSQRETMPDGLIEFWRRDLGERLTIGVARTPLSSQSGALWLSRWGWISLIVALTLYAAGGYEAGFIRINAATSAYPDWVWEWLTVLGDVRVVAASALIFGLRYPRVLWALIIAALIGIAYSRGLKELIEAGRPPQVLAADTFNLIGPAHRQASFPSGHTVTASLFFGILIYYTPWMGLRALFLALAVLAGLSRVAVGVHWPVDVAAGMLGGVTATWIGATLAARWPGPATLTSVHLAFVALASVLAITLLYDAAGYDLAAMPLAILGSAALGVVAFQYLWRPVWRYRRTMKTTAEST
jgi:membrane-associated phospholipid phosphatase